MCCSSPPPPNYQPLADASKQSADVMAGISREQLDFAKKQYADLYPMAQQIAQQQIAAQNQQMQQGQEYYDYLKGTFRPLEQGLVSDAMKFSIKDFQEQLAREAAAASGRAFSSTQAASERAAASRGISPTSGASLALGSQNLLGLSAQRANMMNQARQQAEATGWARRVDAAGLGRGLSGASTGAYQAATGAGSAGIGTAMAPGNQYMTGAAQSAQTMGSGLGMQIGGLGNILGSQTSVYNAEMSRPSPLGTIAGIGLGAFTGGAGAGLAKQFFPGSDIRLKQDITHLGHDARTGLPLYEFAYKADPSARFRGVMAHDVERFMPEAVHTDNKGFKSVDYGAIGIPFERVA